MTEIGRDMCYKIVENIPRISRPLSMDKETVLLADLHFTTTEWREKGVLVHWSAIGGMEYLKGRLYAILEYIDRNGEYHKKEIKTGDVSDRTAWIELAEKLGAMRLPRKVYGCLKEFRKAKIAAEKGWMYCVDIKVSEVSQGDAILALPAILKINDELRKVLRANKGKRSVEVRIIPKNVVLSKACTSFLITDYEVNRVYI